MKICYILENFYPRIGGHETLFLELTKGMIKKGHQVRVITKSRPNAKPEENLNGIKIFRYNWPDLFGHAIPFYYISKDSDKHSKWADIIHTSTYSAAPPALKVAKKNHKPCIITVHENLGQKWFWVTNYIFAFIFMNIEKWVISRSYAAYHTVSNATKKDLIRDGINEKKIHMIYNGVKKESFDLNENESIYKTYNLNPGIKNFFFFGRYGKPKGLPVLIKAIALFKKQNPKNNIKFCFATDRPERLKKDCKKIGITNKVVIKKNLPRNQLLNCIKTTNCVIVPSYTEGFGFTTTETCQIGTPIIASDAGSIPEVISGKHLLFKNRSANDLAKKINLALKNQFQESPLKIFSWEDSINKIEKIYLKLIT